MLNITQSGKLAVLSTLSLAALLVWGVYYFTTSDSSQNVVVSVAESKDSKSSVEFSLAEMSPRGEAGGYAMPASGCSSPTHIHLNSACDPTTIIPTSPPPSTSDAPICTGDVPDALNVGNFVWQTQVSRLPTPLNDPCIGVGGSGGRGDPMCSYNYDVTLTRTGRLSSDGSRVSGHTATRDFNGSFNWLNDREVWSNRFNPVSGGTISIDYVDCSEDGFSCPNLFKLWGADTEAGPYELVWEVVGNSDNDDGGRSVLDIVWDEGGRLRAANERAVSPNSSWLDSNVNASFTSNRRNSHRWFQFSMVGSASLEGFRTAIYDVRPTGGVNVCVTDIPLAQADLDPRWDSTNWVTLETDADGSGDISRGDTVRFNGIIENKDDRDSGEFVWRYSVDVPGVAAHSHDDTTWNVGVRGNSSRNARYSYTIPIDNSVTETQTFRVRLRADQGNQVAESNEGNNEVGWRNLNVRPTPFKDLEPTTPSVSPSSPYEGTDITVSTNIRNNGLRETITEDFQVRFQFDLDGDLTTTGDRVITNRTVTTNLNPDQQVPVSIAFDTSGFADGADVNAAVRVRVDRPNDVNERNEGNNDSGWRSFTIRDLPDAFAKLEVNTSDGSGWSNVNTTPIVYLAPGRELDFRWNQNVTNASNLDRLNNFTDRCAASGFDTSDDTTGDTTPGASHDQDVVAPSIGATNPYSIGCFGPGGASELRTVDVTTTWVEINANTPVVRNEDETVTISWDINPAAPGVIDRNDCSLFGPGIALDPLPSDSGSRNTTISATSLFQVSCDNTGDGVSDVSDELQVTILPQIQEF